MHLPYHFSSVVLLARPVMFALASADFSVVQTELARKGIWLLDPNSLPGASRSTWLTEEEGGIVPYAIFIRCQYFSTIITPKLSILSSEASSKIYCVDYSIFRGVNDII